MVARGCKWLQVVASGKISCLHPFATTCNHLQPPQPLRTKYSKSISDSDKLISDSNYLKNIDFYEDARGCKAWKLVCSHLRPLGTSCISLRPHRKKDTSQISDSDNLISDSNYLKNIDFYEDARGRKRLQVLEIDVRPLGTPWNLLRPLASS